MSYGRSAIEFSLSSLVSSAAVLEYRRLATNLEQAQSAWQQAMVNNDTAAFDYRAVNTLENLVTNRSVTPFVDDNPRQQRTALAGVVALTLALLIVTPMANSLRRSGGGGRRAVRVAHGLIDDSGPTIIPDKSERPIACCRRGPMSPTAVPDARGFGYT